MEPGTLARIDALGPHFSTKWRPASRSDILRGLILTALDRLESGAAGSRSPPGRAPSSRRARKVAASDAASKATPAAAPSKPKPARPRRRKPPYDRGSGR